MHDTGVPIDARVYTSFARILQKLAVPGSTFGINGSNADSFNYAEFE